MGFPWGLDLGNQNCVIAIARKGGIDVIDNEASSRKVRLFDLACTRARTRVGPAAAGPVPRARRARAHGRMGACVRGKQRLGAGWSHLAKFRCALPGSVARAPVVQALLVRHAWNVRTGGVQAVLQCNCQSNWRTVACAVCRPSVSAWACSVVGRQTLLSCTTAR